MVWLFGQMWFLLAVAFLLGAAIAWLIARVLIARSEGLDHAGMTGEVG